MIGGVLSGGDFILGGGFWGGGAVARETRVYLPLVLRGAEVVYDRSVGG